MKNTAYTILKVCFCFIGLPLIITSCSVLQKDKAEIEKISSDIFEEAIDESTVVPSNAKTQKEEKKSA